MSSGSKGNAGGDHVNPIEICGPDIVPLYLSLTLIKLLLGALKTPFINPVII